LTLGLLVAIATSQSWLWRVDQTLYDNAIGLFQRKPQSDIVIVGIDEESLAKLGRWPWRRDIHGLLIDKISKSGPKVIVLDVILSELDRRFPIGDDALAAAIAASGKVILPISMHAEGGSVVSEARPAEKFALGAASLSHISAPLDPDGLLRSVYLRAGMGEARHDISALAALRFADAKVWTPDRALPGEKDQRPTVSARNWVQNFWFHVPFVGPPGHFPVVSYIDALAMSDTEAAQVFGNRFVLVGATAPALTDSYPTPVSGASRSMPGIEVQANLLQSLSEGIDIRRLGTAPSVIISLAILFSVMLALPFLAPRTSLVVTLAAAVATLVFSALLFRHANLWWPPTVAFFAALLSYPLWSWRKLEATQRYFDDELERLRREPNIVPLEGSQHIAPDTKAIRLLPGMIENRISTVQDAANRLRSLNRFIAEAWRAFPMRPWWPIAKARFCWQIRAPTRCSRRGERRWPRRADARLIRRSRGARSRGCLRNFRARMPAVGPIPGAIRMPMRRTFLSRRAWKRRAIS
jgi:CHASE2 domain-containing sensor protein